LGTGALEHHPQFVGCLGDQAWRPGLIHVMGQWVIGYEALPIDLLTHYPSRGLQGD
jgi:hypothetical protein